MPETPFVLPDERELRRRAQRDAWQEGHDLVCDFANVPPGVACTYHPNPYDAES